MTCQLHAGGCGHQFCWVCLGDWASHRMANQAGSVCASSAAASAAYLKRLHADALLRVHEVTSGVSHLLPPFAQQCVGAAAAAGHAALAR